MKHHAKMKSGVAGSASPRGWKEGERRELQYEGKGIGMFVTWKDGWWYFTGESRYGVHGVMHAWLVNHPKIATGEIGEWKLRFSFLKWEWKARPAIMKRLGV